MLTLTPDDPVGAAHGQAAAESAARAGDRVAAVGRLVRVRFFLTGQGPTRNWGHGSGAPAMNAALCVYPQLNAVVVALANLDPLAADNEADFYANRMALQERDSAGTPLPVRSARLALR